MNCTTNVRKVGDVAIVDLIGRFTVADSPGRLRDTVAGTFDGGARNVLLNLAGVTLMDSAAGVGELVSSYTSAMRHGGRLKLLHVNKNISHVLHITRLHTIFEMYDDEHAAVESFRSRPAGPGLESLLHPEDRKSA